MGKNAQCAPAFFARPIGAAEAPRAPATPGYASEAERPPAGALPGIGLAGFDSICSSRKTLGSNLSKYWRNKSDEKQSSADVTKD